MAFEIDSNYKDNAGVSRVVFSAQKPVLEVELNEAQLIQNTQMKRIIKNLFGSGISDLGAISYDGTNLKVASGCYMTCGGYHINCTGLSIPLIEGQTAYLQVWEEVVTYSGTLKKEGNQQSTETISNYIKDTRGGIETTRRMVVKYTLATAQTGGRDNLAIAKIKGGSLVRLASQINVASLYEKVVDLTESVGEIHDAIGCEFDVENNIYNRVGDNEFWTAGDDYNQSDIYKKRVRVNVTDDGTIVAVYGDEAYTDTGALTVAVVGTNGTTYAVGTKVQSMVYQPRFYYKRVPIKLVKQGSHTYHYLKGYHLFKFRDYISPIPKPGFKLHPAFELEDKTVLDGYLVGQYDGCIFDKSAGAYDKTDSVTADFTATTGDQLSSIADAKPASGKTNNLTRSNVRVLCSNIGSGYQQLDLAITSAEQMLFSIEYASFNSQETLGAGVTTVTDDGKSNLSIPTPTNPLGNKSGNFPVKATINDKEYTFAIPVFRGVCNFHGNIWTFIDGFFRNNQTEEAGNEAYVATNNFADTLTAAFKASGFSMAITEGYVKAFGYSLDCDWTYLTSLTGGDSSKPVGDYYWVNMATKALYIALLGADWYYGTYAGFFCWSVHDVASHRDRHLGGRLCRRGKLKYATASIEP